MLLNTWYEAVTHTQNRKAKRALLVCTLFACLLPLRLNNTYEMSTPVPFPIERKGSNEMTHLIDTVRVIEARSSSTYEAEATSSGKVDGTICPSVELPSTAMKEYPPPIPPNATLSLQPILGNHRCDQDAVMAVATGYKLPQLIVFIETLLQTGYTGDVVLGVYPQDFADMQEYFEYHQSSLIVYPLRFKCRRRNKGPICQLHSLYKSMISENHLKDARSERFLAMLRFEVFWAWTTHYGPASRIMVSDARDVYFQLSPFDSNMDMGGLAKRDPSTQTTLHVFQEDSTIRYSTPTRNWVTNLFGAEVANPILDLPVLCSGTTMGGRAAMDIYLRAMVYQRDHTNRTLFGGDQGVHNYLIHTQFTKMDEIKVRSFPPGHGAVNTVGLTAIRRGPLRKIGVVDDQNRTLNHDGQLSPVVHMFDRDLGMRAVIQERSDSLLAKWESVRHKRNRFEQRRPQS